MPAIKPLPMARPPAQLAGCAQLRWDCADDGVPSAAQDVLTPHQAPPRLSQTRCFADPGALALVPARVRPGGQPGRDTRGSCSTPVAVGTPRVLRALAMPCSDVTPAACISATMGATSVALAITFVLTPSPRASGRRCRARAPRGQGGPTQLARNVQFHYSLS